MRKRKRNATNLQRFVQLTRESSFQFRREWDFGDKQRETDFVAFAIHSTLRDAMKPVQEKKKGTQKNQIKKNGMAVFLSTPADRREE
jgi:hypothetical protein